MEIMSDKPLSIVGLDPGTTTAGAVLDLRGKAILLFSSRELPLSKIINRIVQVSLPVAVSTDKAKAPALVEELARKVGAKLITPPADLLREEKRKMIAEKEIRTAGNEHEQDALAAALYAHQELLPRLQKIERFIAENGLAKLKDEFILLAMKEEELNFNLIKDILTKPAEENKAIQRVLNEESITKRDFLRLFDKLKDEQMKNALLSQQLGELNHQLRVLEIANKKLGKSKDNFDQRVGTLLKFKEDRIKLLDNELRKAQGLAAELNQKIISLFGFMEKIPRYRLLKKLDSLGEKELSGKMNVLKINDKDVLFVTNPNSYSEQALKQLEGKDLIIVSLEKINRVVRGRFPTAVLIAEDLIASNEYFALVKPEVLQEKLSRKVKLDEMVNEYKEERKKEK